jgi:hypothetical protein
VAALWPNPHCERFFGLFIGVSAFNHSVFNLCNGEGVGLSFAKGSSRKVHRGRFITRRSRGVHRICQRFTSQGPRGVMNPATAYW